MRVIFLLNSASLKMFAQHTLDVFEKIQTFSLALIGICVLMQIVSLIVNVTIAGGSASSFTPSMSHVLKSIFYAFCLLFFSSWILVFDNFTTAVQKGYLPDDMTNYRKKVLTKMLDRANESLDQDSLLTASLTPEQRVELDKISKTDQSANKEKSKQFKEMLLYNAKMDAMYKTIGGSSEEAPWYESFGADFLGFPATVALSILSPIVRDLSIMMVDVMVLIVIAFLPFAFVFSSIPKTQDTVVPTLLLLVAIKLWQVVIWGLDQLRAIFEVIYAGNMAGDMNFKALFPWIFLGLYIFVPKVLDIFWSHRASNLASSLNVGVTYALAAAKSAATSGMSNLSKSM